MRGKLCPPRTASRIFCTTHTGARMAARQSCCSLTNDRAQECMHTQPLTESWRKTDPSRHLAIATYIVVFVELLAVLLLPLAPDLRLDLVERVEEELLHLTPLVHDHLTTQITHRYKREGDVSGICTKKDYAGLLNTT